MKSPKPRAPKRKYRKPKLVSYGNVRELTHAMGAGGSADGGGGGPATNKTML